MSKLEKLAIIGLSALVIGEFAIAGVCCQMNRQDYAQSSFSFYKSRCKDLKEKVSVKAKVNNDGFMLDLLNSSYYRLCNGDTPYELSKDGFILESYIKNK